MTSYNKLFDLRIGLSGGCRLVGRDEQNRAPWVYVTPAAPSPLLWGARASAALPRPT